jgi:hypothetical protein
MVSNVGKQYCKKLFSRAPFFATGDNSSNIAGAVFSILDAALSGGLSVALTFINDLKTRTILCDALIFVCTEAKYIYLCARAQTIKLSKNEVSYMRMGGDLTEFWTKEMTVDIGKLTMNVFDIPLVPSTPDDESFSQDERDLLVDLMGDPTRAVAETAKALAVGETLAATQVMKRSMAKVQIQMDSSSMSHMSPKWDAEMDNVTFKSKTKIDVTVGGQSKITINLDGLTEEMTKLTQDLKDLELKAASITTNATNYTIKSTRTEMQGQMIQFG